MVEAFIEFRDQERPAAFTISEFTNKVASTMIMHCQVNLSILSSTHTKCKSQFDHRLYARQYTLLKWIPTHYHRQLIIADLEHVKLHCGTCRVSVLVAPT